MAAAVGSTNIGMYPASSTPPLIRGAFQTLPVCLKRANLEFIACQLKDATVNMLMQVDVLGGNAGCGDSRGPRGPGRNAGDHVVGVA